ncbi:hypothetical protein H7X46_15195 [Pseudonocardia sp. C8]|uniref:hypothetical protein n=1 Tax=Pseudonocardia sp. C8 TaxID=2762759 RepID=UPI00164282AF|nr:hypothetical protein [Pseudonocardia sp. C8]MBC3192410.1 hypothetical protein [Pseudonocardia sp. C8]
MPAPNRHASPDRPAPAPVLAFRVLTLAAVAVLAWQFVTAGGLFTGGDPGLHGAGAIVLHVVTGLAALAAGWLRAVRAAPWWPVAVAASVFAFSFVQAWFGEIPGLVVHVPGAMALTAGTVWLAAWGFLRLR